MTAHRLASMQRYGNRHGHSCVVADALADGAIAVRCGSGETDVYTADSAGAEAVATMQRLAKAGRGLSTSINRSVRDNDADKIGSRPAATGSLARADPYGCTNAPCSARLRAYATAALLR